MIDGPSHACDLNYNPDLIDSVDFQDCLIHTEDGFDVELVELPEYLQAPNVDIDQAFVRLLLLVVVERHELLRHLVDSRALFEDVLVLRNIFLHPHLVVTVRVGDYHRVHNADHKLLFDGVLQEEHLCVA